MDGQPHDVSDNVLIEAVVCAQDQEAFAQLVVRHHAKAFSLAWQITRNRELADDAVQEACIRAWRYASSYRSTGSVRNWLLRITARESLRQLKRNPQADPSLEEIHNVPAPDSESPLDKAAIAEACHALQEGLHTLPQIHRLVMVMYYGAGMSQKEIGQELGITQQAISYRLEDGLQKLKAHLGTVGLATAVPLCTPENLAGTIFSGKQPSPQLVDSLVGNRSWVKPAKADAGASRRSSRTQAPTAHGIAALPAVLAGTALVLAAGLGTVFLWPARSQEPSQAPEHASAPDTNRLAQPAGTSPRLDGAIYFDWKAADRVLNGIEAQERALTLESDPLGWRVAQNRVSEWTLPEVPGQQAYAIKAIAAPGKDFTIGAEWTAQGHRLLSRIYFDRRLPEPLVRNKPADFTWIFVDDFLVLLVNDQVVRLCDYKPLPPEPLRVRMNGRALLISRIVLRSLKEDEQDAWRARVRELVRTNPKPQPYIDYENR
ncbi:MAG: sigma-70 family RNA polymerase sigma factor [Planctomycetes bacterium]|nr:sigma-70 family RNA polymerase sigma factor [Planctomycetota bacterium]